MFVGLEKYAKEKTAAEMFPKKKNNVVNASM